MKKKGNLVPLLARLPNEHKVEIQSRDGATVDGKPESN